MPSMRQALAPPRPRTNETAGGGEGMVLATADAMAGGEAHVLGGTVLFFFFLNMVVLYLASEDERFDEKKLFLESNRLWRD